VNLHEAWEITLKLIEEDKRKAERMGRYLYVSPSFAWCMVRRLYCERRKTTFGELITDVISRVI